MSIGRRRSFVKALMLGWVNFCLPTVKAESYRPLPLEYPNYPDYKLFTIAEPGRYALTRDVIQKGSWGAGHSGPKGSPMITLLCSSVELDFQGYTLGADFGVAGISMSARNNVEMHRGFPAGVGEPSSGNRFVFLHDGVIDLARGDHTGAAVKLVDKWNRPGIQSGRRDSECNRYASCPERNINYLPNAYRFEKLKILSKQLGLAAEGDHTVLSNCVIEAAGTAAVFIAGPNVTIENCEIRLRKLIEGDDAYNRPTRAAIVLHDGSNAVIRNNRIRVDYGGMPSYTHCILVHDGATNVVIEGNTFINVEGDPVTLTDGSEAVITGNKSERRWWR